MAGKAQATEGGVDPLKAARQFMAPPPKMTDNDDPVQSGGHNLVIDRRDPNELLLRIALDAEAMAAMLKPTKADGKDGAPVLAKAVHPSSRFSYPLKIDGKQFWLNLALTQAKQSA